MTTKQERVSDVIAKLEELIVQATTEHSHYYVASVCKEALKELQQLRAALPKVRAALEMIQSHLAGSSHTLFPINVRELDGSISSIRQRSSEGKAYDQTIEALAFLDSLKVDK